MIDMKNFAIVFILLSTVNTISAQFRFNRKLYIQNEELIGIAICHRDSVVFNICQKNEQLLQNENSYILNTSVSKIIEKPFKYTLSETNLYSISIADEFDSNPFLVMTNITTSDSLELNLNSSYAQSSFKNFNGSSYAFDKIMWLTIAREPNYLRNNTLWFDLEFDENQDLLLAYLSDNKKLEVWNYPHGVEGYPMTATRPKSIGNGERYFPILKQTYKLKKYLDFNLILINDQNYLIDDEGKIFLLGESKRPEKVSTIKDYKEKTLLIDQTKNKLWVVETSNLYLDMSFGEIFKQYAEEVKL